MHRKSQHNLLGPSAFNSQKSMSYSKGRPNKTTTECNYCHKKGHWAQECQKHLADEKRKNANTATQKGKGKLTSVFSSSNSKTRDNWIGHTGTEYHIIQDCNSFTEYNTLSGEHIKGVGGIKAPIHRSGTITIAMRSCTGTHSVELRDCLHVPENDGNLLSLQCFDCAGGEIWIKSDQIRLITKNGIKLCQGQAHGKSLYSMDMWTKYSPAVMARTMGRDSDGQIWEEWHKAMGHITPQTLKSMHDSGTVEGMKIIPSLIDFNCDTCIQGKHSVHSLPKESTTEYKEIGKLIVTDVWGLAQINGRGRFQYFISFTDVAT